MDTEVREILDCIEENSKSKGTFDFIAETKAEIVLVIALIASSILTPFFIRLKYENMSSIAAVVAILSGSLYILPKVVDTFKCIKNPLSGYSAMLEGSIEKRISYIEHLSKFSYKNLEIVVNALEYHHSEVHKRLGFLMGAVNKVGFIPAGLALYYSASKILSGSDYILSTLLAAFVFGLYLGAMVGYRMADALERNLGCLKEALEIARRKQRLKA